MGSVHSHKVPHPPVRPPARLSMAVPGHLSQAIPSEVEGHPVAARQGRVTAIAFHTELGRDDRLHKLFLADIASSDDGAGAEAL